MERPKDRRLKEEVHMDWKIATCKAAVCIRKYKETGNRSWLEKADAHLKAANSFLQDLDRYLYLVADPVEHVGADLPHKEPFINTRRSSDVFCGV